MSSRQLAKVLFIGQTFLLGKVQWIKMSGTEKNHCQICHPTLSNLKKTHSSYFAKNIFDEKKTFVVLATTMTMDLFCHHASIYYVLRL